MGSRAIVNDDNLDVVEGLGDHACDGLANQARPVIRWNDDHYTRHRLTIFCLPTRMTNLNPTLSLLFDWDNDVKVRSVTRKAA